MCPASLTAATLSRPPRSISLPSVTPEDAGCLELLADALQPMGFACERIDSGPDSFRVRNLWARRSGTGADRPVLVFAGHTDVVPTGPLEQWSSPPFVPTHRDGKLYGRGASDMKTSIAAFVVALEEFLAETPAPSFDIALLLTSDEEGPSVDGTKVVVELLRERGERLDWCIVGEPTSVERTGDMIDRRRRLQPLQGARPAVGGRHPHVRRGPGVFLHQRLAVRALAAALHLHQQLRAVCLVPHRLRHHRAGDGLHGPGQLERRLSTAVPSMGTSHLRVAFFSAWASGLTRMTGAWLPRENPCTSENEDVLWL